MQRTTTLKMLLGTYVAAAFVVAPGMAGAAKSYQGDDWPWPSSEGRSSLEGSWSSAPVDAGPRAPDLALPAGLAATPPTGGAR
jgi:hypothetical protein